MSIHYRTKGFVFKKNDRGETDRIFTLFTKDFGKIEILGRAIRKINSKLRGGIGIISLSEVEFIQGKTYKTLTDAVILKEFKNIKGDFDKLKVIYQIAEATDTLIKEQEKDEQIWDLLDEVFNKLDNEGFKFQVPGFKIYYYFLWNFFSILGYKPELFYCAVCQKKLNPDRLYFSSNEGGVVCSFCAKTRPEDIRLSSVETQCRRVNSDLVKILRLILKKDRQTLFKLKIQPASQKLLKEISEDYYSHLLSIHSSSRGF